MSPDAIAETIVTAGAFLLLVAALIAREAVKRGWVRFSVSLGVIPLDKRTEAAEAAPQTVPLGKGRAA